MSKAMRKKMRFQRKIRREKTIAESSERDNSLILAMHPHSAFKHYE